MRLKQKQISEGMIPVKMYLLFIPYFIRHCFMKTILVTSKGSGYWRCQAISAFLGSGIDIFGWVPVYMLPGN